MSKYEVGKCATEPRHEIEVGHLSADPELYAVDCVCGWMAVGSDGRALGFRDESDAVIAHEEHVQLTEVM